MRISRIAALAATLSGGLLLGGPAQATLTVLEAFNGNVGLSTDGLGLLSTTTGTISASVPVGSTVLKAWLYGVYNSNDPAGVTFNGSAITYDVDLPNTTACCDIGSRRADVTGLVAPTINGGPGGVYDFDVIEANTGSGHDGTALVVVYSNPALPEATVAILDGFADVTGDTTTLNFLEPLDVDDPGFDPQLYIGDGFSCSGQRSTIEVNGQLLTENAGNFDDGTPPPPAGCQNGNLITVGSFDDPVSPLLPSYADDTEHYSLLPFIEDGDTSIVIETFNASQDDNIFLAAIYTAGIAGVNEPPPPPTGDDDPPSTDVPAPGATLLFLIGLGAVGFGRRFARRRI